MNLRESNQSSIEEIISKIIDYSPSDSSHRLLLKFTVPYLISIIDKDKIAQLEKAFKEYDKKGVDIIDFVRVFLNILEHQSFETLYLIMSLIELFRLISENLNNASFLKLQDITNFICESYMENSVDDYVLKTKKLPEPKKFNRGKTGIREIDINAPAIYGTSEENLQRLVQSRILTDSSHHNNQAIKMGTFAREIRKVFTLDSLSDRISIYDLDCKLEKELRKKQLKEKKDIIILSFAWSDRQQRIGATLKDFSLLFWDAYDHFEFEKQFFVTSGSNEYQTNIWYIDYMDQWLTTDRSNVLNVWDIEKETLTFQLAHKKIQNTIIEVIEIPSMRLIAVGSLDKLLTVWDLTKRAMLFFIDLTIGGIHSLLYFKTYQVLITAGYENSISVFQINPLYLDHDLVGKLIGHNSMVTAIQCIEKTPLLVSSDDNGTLKLWDIRSFKCVQTIEVGSRTVITRILDIDVGGKICFLGSRVNFLDFDRSNRGPAQNEDFLYPIKAEYNYLQDELVVCTRKDLRFLDLETGRVKKIYRGLLRKDDDEITIFKSVEQNKKFVIGDHRGGLSLFLYSNGEKNGNLVGHSNEISSLKVDYGNKLYITGSWDSNVLIQKEEKGVFESKREIHNCFNGKEVNLLELSIYHNLIVTISNNRRIYLWDYEYCRMMGFIELEEGVEPSNVCFINGYGIMIISTTDCHVFIVHFKIDEQNISFRLLGAINLQHSDSSSKDSDLEDAEHSPASNTSSPYHRQSSPYLSHKESSDFKRAVSRNSMLMKSRISLAYKQGDYVEEERSQNSPAQEDENSAEFREKLERKISNTANKLLVDIEFARESEEPRECRLFLGLLKGSVRVYDIFRIFTTFSLELVPHANKRMNYNAFRGAKEDFTVSLKKIKDEGFSISGHFSKEVLRLSKSVTSSFQAHKEQLTTLSIIPLSEKRVLTSSTDCFVKIWSFTGEKLAAVNINHPLPIVWSLQLDRVKRTRKNILFALKIVELIFRRYKRSILLSEEKNINVNSFLNHLANASPRTALKLPSINEEKTVIPVLLRQEYSPRDLHYESIKHIYQRELMGPSLKEMEAEKQIQIAQKVWRSELTSDPDQSKFFAREYLTKRHEEKVHKEREAAAFYESDFREKLHYVPSYDEYTDQVQKLNKMLENSLKRKKPGNASKNALDKSIERKPPGNNKPEKKPNFPSINAAENTIEPSQSSQRGKAGPPIPKIPKLPEVNNSSSLISRNDQTFKPSFLEYASARNLLDSTQVSQGGLSLHENSANINNSSGLIPGKNSFKNVLRNLDKRLKKSQLNVPSLDLPRRSSQVLINLLDNSHSQHSQASFTRAKGFSGGRRSPRRGPKNSLIKARNPGEESRESVDEIDEMLTEMLRNVQDNVRRRLEVELSLKKKEWEIETKRKILKEFRLEEKKKIEEKYQKLGKEEERKQEMGFVGLGRMFSNLGHL